jgi:hypothetical protein
MPDPDAPMPAPHVVLKIDQKSITVAPPPPAPEAVPAAAAAPAAVPAERTYTIDPQKTRVRVVELASERVGPGARVTRSMTERAGTLADVQPGCLVELRARGDLAANIRIVPAQPPPPAVPAPRRPAAQDGGR